MTARIRGKVKPLTELRMTAVPIGNLFARCPQSDDFIDLKIKRTLIRKLAVVATVLAVVAGSIALYRETGQVDDHVVGMVLQEAQGMMEHVAFLGMKDVVVMRASVSRSRSTSSRSTSPQTPSSFVELYDRQRQNKFF